MNFLRKLHSAFVKIHAAFSPLSLPPSLSSLFFSVFPKSLQLLDCFTMVRSSLGWCATPTTTASSTTTSTTTLSSTTTTTTTTKSNGQKFVVLKFLFQTLSFDSF